MTSLYSNLYIYKTVRDQFGNNGETIVEDLNKFNERYTEVIKDYKTSVRKAITTIKANNILLTDLINKVKDKTPTNKCFESLLDINALLDK